jgi:ketosteroid isomerase-like protein
MLKGDSSGYVALLSDHDDVTWGNPFGPFARGRESVEATLASAATRMRGGRAAEFDHIATYLAENLAVVVQVERGETMAEGADALSPAAVRVTSVYRLEGGTWKLVQGMRIRSQRRARRTDDDFEGDGTDRVIAALVAWGDAVSRLLAACGGSRSSDLRKDP